jgi:uncharacterized protein YutE (UPF0331/DUF86 family)
MLSGMRLTKEEVTIIKSALKTLEDVARTLKETYDHCQKIGLKDEYSFLELIYLEALKHRFTRLSDLLVRKIFRLINQLDYEPQETIRDSINRAEKLGIIKDSALFSEIRQVRNAIAHEYLMEDLSQLYKSVFTNTPQLLETVDRVKEYCKRY